MKILKKISLIFLLLAIRHSSNAQAYKQIIQVSIPKCGTTLLEKCIALLTNRIGSTGVTPGISHPMYMHPSHADLERMTSLAEENFYITHAHYSEERAFFLNNSNFINFFIYRDPRDHAVSFTFFKLAHKELFPDVPNISFDKLLTQIIEQTDKLYKKYLLWMTSPRFLALRFEDLVGPQGGGSAQAQRITLQNIIKHLEIDSTEEIMNNVVQTLFGGTGTFREGQIGSWKKYFKPRHVEIFKQHAGQLLIDLGYEKDMNWGI